MVRHRRHISGREAPIPERVVQYIKDHTAFGALAVPRSRKPCDLWLGPINGAGYPHAYWYDAEVGWDYHCTAGGLVYRLTRLDGEPLPDDMVVCHSCDAKTCIHPEHLFLGDRHMNAKDWVRRGSSRDQGVLALEVAKQMQLRRGAERIPAWLAREARHMGLYGRSR